MKKPHSYRIRSRVIGSRVKKARKEAGLKQTEVSAALEVDFGVVLSRNQISRIELEKRSIQDIELYAFSKILAVKVDYFFEGISISS